MTQQINLYQPILGKQRILFSARAMGTALLVLACGLAAMGGYMHWQVESLERALARAGQRHDDAAARLAEVQERLQRAEDPQLVAAVEQAGQDLVREQALAAALRQGNFGNTAGFSPYFIALARAHPTGLWLDGVVIEGAGDYLALRGATVQAELLPRYLKQLAAHPSLAGKSFAHFEMNVPPPPAAAAGDATPPPATLPAGIRFHVATNAAGEDAAR